MSLYRLSMAVCWLIVGKQTLQKLICPPRQADWIKPILEHARSHGWQGFVVTSKYRTIEEQEAIEGRRIPGTSHHEGWNYPQGV